jgi:hypothetical protein
VLLALGIALVVLLAGGARHGGASAHPRPAASVKYGGLPAWLPHPNVKTGRVLNASLAHPALSVQGEAISVSLSGGHLLATAVGPEVPEEGRFPVPEVTPTSFIVTFASARGTIPLRASDFQLVDEQGKVHRPSMTALDGGVPPSTVRPGKPVSVKLHDILPTGDGGLSWIPDGRRPIATWDFTVEID